MNKTGLFNLREDASEQNKLSDQEPAKVKELKSVWVPWNAHNVKALWGGQASGGEDRSRRSRTGATFTRPAGGRQMIERTKSTMYRKPMLP